MKWPNLSLSISNCYGSAILLQISAMHTCSWFWFNRTCGSEVGMGVVGMSSTWEAKTTLRDRDLAIPGMGITIHDTITFNFLVISIFSPVELCKAYILNRAVDLIEILAG